MKTLKWVILILLYQNPKTGPLQTLTNTSVSEEAAISSNMGSTNITPSGLIVIYSNADSLLNRRDELVIIAEIDQPDIIIVTEILPKNRRKIYVDSKEFTKDQYNLFTHNTMDYKGRGVAIYVSTRLTALQTFQENFYQIEVISVKIKLKINDWLLCQGVYRSPSATYECLRELNTFMSRDRDEMHRFSHILIAGDFNYKEINWETETTTVGENQPSAVFFRTCMRQCLTSTCKKSNKIFW